MMRLLRRVKFWNANGYSGHEIIDDAIGTTPVMKNGRGILTGVVARQAAIVQTETAVFMEPFAQLSTVKRHDVREGSDTLRTSGR
jgi:hypothetical protein